MSQTTKKIILVDPYDNELGEIEKHTGHQYGMLHRAFSIVLFREHEGKIQTLLQQRANTKYHAGGLWTNTCCSHPNRHQTMADSVKQRLQEEMGIEVKLHYADKFHYLAILDKNMVENEIDHVFVGVYQSDHVPFNPDEVQATQWKRVDSLQHDLASYPERYTPWFQHALAIAFRFYQANKDLFYDSV